MKEWFPTLQSERLAFNGLQICKTGFLACHGMHVWIVQHPQQEKKYDGNESVLLW